MLRTHSIPLSRPWAVGCFAPGLALLLLTPGCSESDAAAQAGNSGAGQSVTSAAAADVPAVAEAPIAEQQVALLELAFAAVTKMPAIPHIKDRSRAQENVIEACLQLGQPQLAARCIPAIENWHRGTAYADLAYYCAEHGATAEVPKYLELARQVAELPDDALPTVESPQGWRRDRIRAKIAKTHLRLGQADEAAEFETELGATERGEVAAVRAMSADAAACDEQIAALGNLSATRGFDEVEVGLKSAVELYGRFFDDAERRSRLQAAIELALQKVPRQVGIELMLDLTEQALAHQDPAQTTELLEKTRALLEGARWDLDDRTPLVARLSVLRFRSGDVEGARGEVDAALEQFEQDKGALNSVRQARAIRPLAEAYAAMQSTPAALDLYGRAVELGAENPNARPRAEELAATCCSMARHDIKPAPELWARMNQISGELVAPW